MYNIPESQNEESEGLLVRHTRRMSQAKVSSYVVGGPFDLSISSERPLVRT